jgi:hypothetical protein
VGLVISQESEGPSKGDQQNLNRHKKVHIFEFLRVNKCLKEKKLSQGPVEMKINTIYVELYTL